MRQKLFVNRCHCYCQGVVRNYSATEFPHDKQLFMVAYCGDELADDRLAALADFLSAYPEMLIDDRVINEIQRHFNCFVCIERTTTDHAISIHNYLGLIQEVPQPSPEELFGAGIMEAVQCA